MQGAHRNPIGVKGRARWFAGVNNPGFLHIFCGQNCEQGAGRMSKPLIPLKIS
jgi:hypothetical protein